MSFSSNGWSACPVLVLWVVSGCVRAEPAQGPATFGAAPATTDVAATGQQPVVYPAPVTSQDLRVAQLEAQVAQLSAMVTALREAERLSEPELRLVYDRIGALMELEQKTYSAIMLRSDVSCSSERAGDEDLADHEPGSEASLSQSGADGRSLRAVLRALDRIHLSPEQRRTLLLSLYPARDLDPHNPWAPAR